MPLPRWRTCAAAAVFPALAAALPGCGSGGDLRMPVRAITVFGDSLSDVGTYAAAARDAGGAASPGKFTVNPGHVWVEDIAAHYGLALTPQRALTLDKDASLGATDAVGTAVVLGGNGYAEGGARIALRPSQSGIGNNALVAPVREQVQSYLDARGAFAAGELVVIGGGGNDTYAQFSALCWGMDVNGTGEGKTTLEAATQAVAEAASAQVQLVRRIKARGAGVVLLAAASDWSSNPFARHYLSDAYQRENCAMAVTAQQVTAWTQQFNQILRSGISDLSAVVYLQPSDVFGELLRNPQRYGLVNTTDAACTNTTPTSSATFCSAATLAAPDAAQTWFWSDAFHPTPRAHSLLAQRALQMLEPWVRRAD